MLGFHSISEEPISSLRQDYVIYIESSNDILFDLAPYFLVESKSLCWVVNNSIDLEWIIECDENWYIVDCD